MSVKRFVPREVKRLYHGVRRRVKTGLQTAISQTVPAQFNIDSPTQSRVDQEQLTVEGWIIPNPGVQLREVRAVYNDTAISLPFGLPRGDVAKAFPDRPEAQHSGFAGDVEIAHGMLRIEADFGQGFQVLHALEVVYSPELLVKDLYNPDLANNYAEHLNLMANNKQYYFEEDLSGTYERAETDPRLVAFYLPQFHPIKENDEVWGPGFTEWANVTADTPRFIGHRQPILPRDLGFYDLRNEAIIEQQINLAKRHGIYGFCFYYYWFSGKRILEKPIDSFLKHTEWDFNFSICWANENWTKRWDGRESEVIIAQQYSPDDPLKFIQDVEHILLDPRYIQEDGKPVLTVFRASELRQPEEYARVWREYFRKKHKRELQLVSIISFEDKDPRSYGFDKALDFAPQSAFFKQEAFDHGKYPYINIENKKIDPHFSGSVADYRQIALTPGLYDYFDFPTYKCVTPSWDNDARKKGKGFVMMHESPDIYAQWLDTMLTAERNAKAPIIFINAWNEWAEGAILEPSQHYGSAVLNRTTEVLALHSKNPINRDYFPHRGVRRTKGTKLAVVVHLYYLESWERIRKQLRYLDTTPYDLYISLTLKDKSFVETIHDFKSDATITIVPNRGRDVLPFVQLLPKLSAAGYTTVLKLHSKKTVHRQNGGDWLPELLENLIPSTKAVEQLLQELEQGVALIGPAGHFISLAQYMGSNESKLHELIGSMYGARTATQTIAAATTHGYFAGSMFWANLAALKPLRDIYLLPEDFESEQGQIDGTLAHAIERVISLLPVLSKSGKVAASSLRGMELVKGSDAASTYNYAE